MVATLSLMRSVVTGEGDMQVIVNRLLRLRFIRNLFLVTIATYAIAFYQIGIVWDPNGVDFENRPWWGIGGQLHILVFGYLFAFLGGALAVVPLVVGIPLLIGAVIAIRKRRHGVAVKLAYTLAAIWMYFGTRYYCLLA